jgi:hypothetical protein
MIVLMLIMLACLHNAKSESHEMNKLEIFMKPREMTFDFQLLSSGCIVLGLEVG